MTLRLNQALSRIVFLSFAAGCIQGTAQATQPVTHNASAPILFTAISKNGAAAEPAQSDLTVSIDNQPTQVISLHAAKNDPLLFAVVVDVSTSSTKNAEWIRQAATQVFQDLSSNASKGYLVLFNHRVALSNNPLQPSEVQSDLNNVQFGGGTAVYDAISETCEQRLSAASNPDTPRRIIILISDGDDNQSHLHPETAETEAEKEGVAVFALNPSAAGERGEHFLKQISHDTGGEEITGKDSAGDISRLLAAANDQWIVRVAPGKSPDQKLHSLSIKSSQRDIRLSAPSHISLP